MNRPASMTSDSPLRNDPAARLGDLRKAATFEEFLRLTEAEHYTLTGAAAAIGRSPSVFCGSTSLLPRYLRDGIAGLRRKAGAGAAVSELSRKIEALGWFVPAAKFLYFSARQRRGALRWAVHQATRLPRLPWGWRKDTRGKFLERLGLAEAPECPAWLREEIEQRELAGKLSVPERIARQITTASAVTNRYVIELRPEELRELALEPVLKRLVESGATRAIRITLELV